jgi:hypothetical protein
VYFRLPFLCQGVAYVHHACIKGRFGWQAWLIEPCVPVNCFERLGRLFIRSEEVQQSGFELVRVEGFSSPSSKVMRDEEIELLFSNKFFNVVEEVESLCIVRRRTARLG